MGEGANAPAMPETHTIVATPSATTTSPYRTLYNISIEVRPTAPTQTVTDTAPDGGASRASERNLTAWARTTNRRFNGGSSAEKAVYLTSRHGGACACACVDAFDHQRAPDYFAVVFAVSMKVVFAVSMEVVFAVSMEVVFAVSMEVVFAVSMEVSSGLQWPAR
jgi:hypothetical protein